MHAADYQPRCEAELTAAVKALAASGAKVRILGGGSHDCLGLTTPPDAKTLSLQRLHGKHWHQPADLVACFEAGATLCQVQSELARHEQRLDVDPGLPASTLGGAIAADHCGPRADGWGTLRDKVLGLRYVLADGQLIEVGGRVMKNVAGYDLGKLMIGSRGTLGIVSQITFRTNPLPPQEQLWLCPMSSLPIAWERALAVRSSQLEPHVLAVLDRAAATQLLRRQQATPVLLIGAEGVPARIDYHASELATQLGCDPQPQPAAANAALWAEWTAALRSLPEARLLVRCGLRTSQIRHLLPALADGCGTVMSPVRGSVIAGLREIDQLARLRQVCAGLGGYATVVWSCDQLGAEIVWGAARGDIALMRQLKQVHDPQHRLNPGTFYGGI